jgi:hypothetical protein
MNKTLIDYYRCPLGATALHPAGELSMDRGYFTLGEDIVCYGRSAGGFRAPRADVRLYDVAAHISHNNSTILLPFDPEEITQALLRERYSAQFREEGKLVNSLIRGVYYALRPYLGVSTRKHLQKLYLHNWHSIPFPKWPVDCTVDRLQQRLLGLVMRALDIEMLPFVWFWPDGCQSCAIVTHDVEEVRGRDLCGDLMDVDESFGFHSSYQVVPECRYPVPESFLSLIRARACEVNVHDLRHDGRLYAEFDEFLRRVELINQYGRLFGACGFRSGVLYRNADWYGAYDFQYDMSIPNVAHLDPQHGGCCTVMPYFIGKLVELPVTCTQDYALFHVLKEYSVQLWRQQVDIIAANHGLITILVHPDYIMEPRALRVYKSLLEYLAKLRDTQSIWTPLPKEVAEWTLLRNQMSLTRRQGRWQIEGPGSERARVAYASLSDQGVNYSMEMDSCQTVP